MPRQLGSTNAVALLCLVARPASAQFDWLFGDPPPPPPPPPPPKFERRDREVCGADCVVRLHAPTPEEFAAYRGGDRVVVMTGLSENAEKEAWDVGGEWGREAWGEKVNAQGAYDLASRGGLVGRDVADYLQTKAEPNKQRRGRAVPKTLAEYLEVMRQPEPPQQNFAFDSGGFFKTRGGQAIARKLSHDAHTKLGLHTKTSSLLLSLGMEGHGITFHWHVESWLELLAGTKHWWVAPQGTPFAHDPTAGAATVAWVDTVLGGNKSALPPPGVCAFTQLPGETVYVPASHLHATMNEGRFTLGVGAQPSADSKSDWSAWTRAYYAIIDPKHGQDVAEAAAAAIKAYPECADIALANARRLLKDEDTRGALAEAQRALFLNPLELNAGVLRATLLKETGDKEAADQAALDLLFDRLPLRPEAQPHRGQVDTLKKLLSKKAARTYSQTKLSYSSLHA